MASKVESEIEVAAPLVANEANETKTEEMDTTEAPATTEEDIKAKSIKQRQIFVGNPPLVNTEEVLRKKFGEYGEIQNFQTYEFAGSLIAIITYEGQESTKKAVEADAQILEGHRLRVNCAGKLPSSLPIGFMVVAVEDDASLTEDALMTKYSKYGELIQVNKIFPHVYLQFKDKAVKTSALEKCKADNLKLYAIRDVSDVNQHLELVKDQKQYHFNVNKVNISNLAASTTEEVKTLCTKFGEVKVAKFFEYSNKAYTISVYFDKEEIAKKAAEELNGFMHNERRLRALHNITHVIPNYKTSIYITGLKPDTTEEQIYDDFKQYGEIDYVTRMNLKPGCIIIVYKDEDSANKAAAVKVFTRKSADTTETFTNITIAKFDGPLADPMISMKKKRVFGEGENQTVQREKTKMFVKPGSLSSLFPLYVSNIPCKASKSTLLSHFEKKVVVKLVVFMPSEKYAKAMIPPSKIAIVYFSSAKDAETARVFTDQKMFHGKRLNVVNARKVALLPKDRTVYVSELNPKVTEEKLQEHFQKIGPIERVIRSLDNDGFVCFKSKEDKGKSLGPSVDLQIADCSFKIAPARKDFDVKLVKENSSLLEEKLMSLQTSMRMAKKTGQSPKGFRQHLYLLTGKKEHLTKASFTDDGLSPAKRMRFNSFGRGGPGMLGNRGFGMNMPGNNFGGGYHGNDNYSNHNQGGFDSRNIEKLLQLAFMSGKNLGETMSSRNDMQSNNMQTQMSRIPEPLMGGSRFNDSTMPSSRNNDNLGNMFGGGNFNSFSNDSFPSRNGGNNEFNDLSQMGANRFNDFSSDSFGNNDNNISFGRNNDNNMSFGRNQNQSMGRNQNQSIGQKRDNMGRPKNQTQLNGNKNQTQFNANKNQTQFNANKNQNQLNANKNQTQFNANKNQTQFNANKNQNNRNNANNNKTQNQNQNQRNANVGNNRNNNNNNNNRGGNPNFSGRNNSFGGMGAGRNNSFGGNDMGMGMGGGRNNSFGSNDMGMGGGRNNSFGSNDMGMGMGGGRNNSFGSNDMGMGMGGGRNNSFGSNDMGMGGWNNNSGRNNSMGAMGGGLFTRRF